MELEMISLSWAMRLEDSDLKNTKPPTVNFYRDHFCDLSKRQLHLYQHHLAVKPNGKKLYTEAFNFSGTHKLSDAWIKTQFNK